MQLVTLAPSCRIGGNGPVFRLLLGVFFAFSVGHCLPGRVVFGQSSAVRTPQQVADLLLTVYGKKLENNAYIQAMAVMGRLEAANQRKDPQLLAEVERLVQPYATGMTTPSLKSASDLSGHLLFAALARQSSGDAKTRYVEYVTRGALTLFVGEDRDRPRPPDPLEMSDAVFMSGPLLCEAGSLVGDERFYSAAISYLRAMRTQCVRPDGIYRHSPLCEAAWGRGNGFPAIGVARCLERLPQDHPGRGELLAAFQAHLDALLPHQDANGAWHQVIDRPDSYCEFSCTAMIGWALTRGVQEGWLKDPKYTAAADRAWAYIERSIGPGGELAGVCESTGKLKTVEEYLVRKANHGLDDRGGAMALIFALARHPTVLGRVEP